MSTPLDSEIISPTAAPVPSVRAVLAAYGMTLLGPLLVLVALPFGWTFAP